MADAFQFSIVTVSLNSASTIKDTIESVARQEFVSVEHIVKDGGSTDGTLDIVRGFGDRVKLIEAADIGIYDAMNQGFASASGEFVAFLNSDDYLCSVDVLDEVARAFRESGADVVYGDTEIVDDSGAVLRRWKSGNLLGGRLVGQQLPHPSFFVRRSVLSRLNPTFDPKLRIAADFKQQLILMNVMKVRSYYLKRDLARMRHGGESSQGVSAFVRGWRECAIAYREVMGKSGIIFVVMKVARKVLHWRVAGLFRLMTRSQ